MSLLYYSYTLTIVMREYSEVPLQETLSGLKEGFLYRDVFAHTNPSGAGAALNTVWGTKYCLACK